MNLREKLSKLEISDYLFVISSILFAISQDKLINTIMLIILLLAIVIRSINKSSTNKYNTNDMTFDEYLDIRYYLLNKSKTYEEELLRIDKEDSRYSEISEKYNEYQIRIKSINERIEEYVKQATS